jgi:hypothetical protein
LFASGTFAMRSSQTAVEMDFTFSSVAASPGFASVELWTSAA